MIPVAATAFTLARNFGPWFAGVALASFVAGNGTGAWGRGLWDAREVAQARTALSAEQRASAELRVDIAMNVIDGQRKALARLTEMEQRLRVRNELLARDIAQIDGKVASLIAPMFDKFRGLTDAPEFACLRWPLPGPALSLLERPGGIAGSDPAAAGRNSDTPAGVR